MMALKMLAAYYSRNCDSREMLKDLKIGQGSADEFERGLNRYDTLLIDIQDVLGSVLNDPGTQQE